VTTFGDGNVKTYFKLTQWYVGTLPPHPSTNYTPPEILERIELEVAVLTHQEDWLPIYWFSLAVVPEAKPTTSLSSVAALIHDKVILQKDSENRQHLGIQEQTFQKAQLARSVSTVVRMQRMGGRSFQRI